jgi:nucleoside phosphorylase
MGPFLFDAAPFLPRQYGLPLVEHSCSLWVTSSAVCPAARKISVPRCQDVPRALIKAGERFIEQQDFRMWRQRARKGDTLLLPPESSCG